MAGRKLATSASARELAVTVHLYDPSGSLVSLNPGDEVPEWAELGDHCFTDGAAVTDSENPDTSE